MSHEPMSQLMECRLLHEQTSHDMSANGKCSYLMSPRSRASLAPCSLSVCEQCFSHVFVELLIAS